MLSEQRIAPAETRNAERRAGEIRDSTTVWIPGEISHWLNSCSQLLNWTATDLAHKNCIGAAPLLNPGEASSIRCNPWGMRASVSEGAANQVTDLCPASTLHGVSLLLRSQKTRTAHSAPATAAPCSPSMLGNQAGCALRRRGFERGWHERRWTGEAST